MAIARNFHHFVDELEPTAKFRGPSESLEHRATQAIAVRRGWAPDGPEMQALRSDQRRRYIVAPPRFERSAGPSGRVSLERIASTIQPSVLRSEGADGAKLLLLSPLEAAILKERFSALALEEDIQYRLPRTPLVPPVEPIAVPASQGQTITIVVRGPASALGEARVILLPRGDRADGYEGVTDATGALRLTVRSGDTRFAKVIVIPRCDHWSRALADVPCTPTMTIDVTPLSPRGFDWGLRETGALSLGDRRGRGIKVAVIDTGIARHPSLEAVLRGGKNFILEEDPGAWDRDQDGHGTHCAGVIAALARERSTWGYAPEVGLYAYRVFGGKDGGGWAYDIAEAIREAIREGCDVVNLSLASLELSSKVRKSIEEAVEAGVLCVAAAGNEGGPVAYPAKLPDVLAVAAVGKTGTYPRESIHDDARGDTEKEGWFFASFSNRGPEVDLAAPGVAITSTLPPEGFAAWDGTSMACPHVTGMAALVLDVMAQGAAPAELPRSPERATELVDRILGICKDVGMARDCQGAGMPQVNRLYAGVDRRPIMRSGGSDPSAATRSGLARNGATRSGSDAMVLASAPAPSVRPSSAVPSSAVPSSAVPSNIRPPTAVPSSALLKVLVIAANPASSRRLRIKDEILKIERELRRANAGVRIAFRACRRASPERVVDEIMRFRPDIVHFIAHGSAFDGIVLEGEDGEERLLDAATFGAIFRVLGASVRVVVLNACFSRSYAAAIVQHVACAIGMNMPIEDAAAVGFANAFYGAVGEGHSVQGAFDLACALHRGDARPELLAREGLDAGAMILVKRRPPPERLPVILLAGFIVTCLFLAILGLPR